jgi:hypothetical protein
MSFLTDWLSSSWSLPNNSEAKTPAVKEARTVEVEFERFLLQVTPEQAKKAWFDYTWTKGDGGGPYFNLPLERNAQGLYTKRVLFPTLTEEILTDCETETDQNNVVEYKVSKLGFFLEKDLVADSHAGTVEFIPTADGTKMAWTVTFDCEERFEFWKRVTQFSIGSACDHYLVSYLAATSQIMLADSRRTRSTYWNHHHSTNDHESCLDGLYLEAG